MQSLRSVRDKVIGLLETLSDALQNLAEVDAQKSEPFGKLAEKFLLDLSEIRQLMHGHILRLGADIRVEDQCREQFLKADTSVQKLIYIHEMIQKTLKDLKEVQNQ